MSNAAEAIKPSVTPRRSSSVFMLFILRLKLATINPKQMTAEIAINAGQCLEWLAGI